MGALEFITGPGLWTAAAVCLVASGWQVARWARMPRHLRWELYPLPHAGPAGSTYQQVDYAGQPRHVSRMAEAAFMAAEILLLKKVFAHRRDLWLGSYLLHVGLYLSIACLGFLILAGATAYWRGPSPLAEALRVASRVVGLVGTVGGAAGSLMLIARRWRDAGLRAMSDRLTYLNLALLALLFTAGGAALLFPASRVADGLAAALLGLFLVYLPFSRMFHFAAKYFFYHRVLWDDVPMAHSGGMQRDIASYLAYRQNWAAPHIEPGQTWASEAGKGQP